MGTGVFTGELYRALAASGAHIVGVDYWMGMLRQARSRCEAARLTDVTLVRADVGSLPLEDNSIDLCITMNGFHAFPDKQSALNEIARVFRARYVGPPKVDPLFPGTQAALLKEKQTGSRSAATRYRYRRAEPVHDTGLLPYPQRLNQIGNHRN